MSDTMLNEEAKTLQGWYCPKCKTVNSPYSTYCHWCAGIEPKTYVKGGTGHQKR